MVWVWMGAFAPCVFGLVAEIGVGGQSEVYWNSRSSESLSCENELVGRKAHAHGGRKHASPT